jgi:hypothetical protein
MEGSADDFESADFVRALKPGSVVADVIFNGLPQKKRLDRYGNRAEMRF